MPASLATGQAWYAASSCPAIRSASGSRPHQPATCSTACGAAAARSAPDQPSQQRRGLLLGQDIQADPLIDLQAGQHLPAGDQHQRPPGPGQQRPDLRLGRRVVQQYQHPPGG
jgi:hypothetical protein